MSDEAYTMNSCFLIVTESSLPSLHGVTVFLAAAVSSVTGVQATLMLCQFNKQMQLLLSCLLCNVQTAFYAYSMSSFPALTSQLQDVWCVQKRMH